MKILILITILNISNQSSAIDKIKVNGSTTVNPVVVDAAIALKQQGMEILVDTQGGSSGGVSYVAEGLADLGMVSRHINQQDRKKFANAHFEEHVIGYDGVALVISKTLFDSGVTAVSKNEIKDIYEGRIQNWKSLGGSNLRITFFNKEPGRGTWEVFAKYIYGDTSRAKKVFHQEVGANQEARTKVALNPGGITQLSASWAYGSSQVRPLAIKVKNHPIEPNLVNIAEGTYPMRRPLIILSNGKVTGIKEKFINYLTSSDGQKILKKHGYLPIEDKGT